MDIVESSVVLDDLRNSSSMSSKIKKRGKHQNYKAISLHEPQSKSFCPSMHGKVEELKKRLDNHDDDISSLKSVIVHQQAFIDTLIEQVTSLKSIVGELLPKESTMLNSFNELSDLELDLCDDLLVSDRPKADVIHHEYVTNDGRVIKNIKIPIFTDEEPARKIVSWKFDKERNVYVVKRVKGIIQYFEFAYQLQTLSAWEFRELGDATFINSEDDKEAAYLHKMIVKECEHGFQVFSPQRPKCKRSRLYDNTIHKSGKMVLSLQSADVMKKVPLPSKVPECLQKLIKWYHNPQTGEAVIRTEDQKDIRLLDPMDVFMFEKKDLIKLAKKRIICSPSGELQDEANYFSAGVYKALKDFVVNDE